MCLGYASTLLLLLRPCLPLNLSADRCRTRKPCDRCGFLGCCVAANADELINVELVSRRRETIMSTRQVDYIVPAHTHSATTHNAQHAPPGSSSDHYYCPAGGWVGLAWSELAWDFGSLGRAGLAGDGLEGMAAVRTGQEQQCWMK